MPVKAPVLVGVSDAADTLTVKNQSSNNAGNKFSSRYKHLYKSYKKVIIHSLVKRGIAKGEAEELTQEAFTKLLDLNEQQTPSYLKTYVYRVAHNLAIDQFRKKSRTPFVEFDLGVDAETYVDQDQRSPSAQESLEMKEAAKSILSALNELPESTKQAFVMFKINGNNYADIAKKMNISESMVRKHVLKAIRQCYDKLDGDY
jgi:RNA polymerase sigma-70 factor (ECF subfamily)